MTFEVEVDGQRRTLTVEAVRAGDGGAGAFRVVLDGVPHEVTIVPTDVGLTATFDGGRIVDAALTPLARGEWLVQLPRVAVLAAVDPRRHTSGGTAAALTGAQRVTAPMPGRVARLLVKPGDVVTSGQGLIVVEAMKMENELVSPKAGTIKDVSVAEGQSIEAGRLLVIVE